jgi:hypothetical protein
MLPQRSGAGKPPGQARASPLPSPALFARKRMAFASAKVGCGRIADAIIGSDPQISGGQLCEDRG